MKRTVVLVLAGLLAPCAVQAQDVHLETARRVLAVTPLFDGHNDLPWVIRENEDAPRDVVAYDSDLEELVSARVAAALIRQGYRASALKGGLAEWVTAKFPTDPKNAPMMAPPKAS